MKLFAGDESVKLARIPGKSSYPGGVRVLPGVWKAPDPAERAETDAVEPLSSSSASAAKGRSRIWTGWWSLGVFAVLLPLFFLTSAKKAAQSNSGITDRGYHVIFDYDQHPYLNLGRKMRLSGYTKVAPRHRMPGYAVLVSLLYSDADAYPVDPTGKDPRGVSDGYFQRAKWFNILISGLCLVALYFVSRRFLPPLESHVITWGFGFTVAVAKAPYVQPEVLFYTLFLIGLIGLWSLLRNPSWKLAGGTGIVLVAAFLLKSTVLPLIALFAFCALLRWIQRACSSRISLDRQGLLEQGRAVAPLFNAVGVVAIFGMLLVPYFRNNVDMYGSPLWDAHSRHYLWMDSPEEKKFWRSAGISDPDFVSPEDREIPTAATWWAQNDLGDALKRIEKGWNNNRRLVRKSYPGAYYLSKNLLLVLVIALALLCWRKTRGLMNRRWLEILLLTAFFAGYGLLYCWYQAIDVGPRLIMALFLPALFFLVLAVHRYSDGLWLRIGKFQAPLRVAFSVILIGFIAYSTLQSLGGYYWTLEGGK